MNSGEAVKQIRKQSLLSQQDFAEVLGVSFSAVNRWENNKAKPSYQALKKIRNFCEQQNILFCVDDFEKCIEVVKENRKQDKK